MKELPQNHPIRGLFRKLTDRALTQSALPDKDILLYLSDLLVEFISTENLYHLTDEEGRRLIYLIDMLEQASQQDARSDRRRYYKHIGDYSLFILGMFPESLESGRRSIPQSYYVDTGRRSYLAASALDPNSEATIVFRKLADKYERCVLSLSWVREYTKDPFYQYMLREYGIM